MRFASVLSISLLAVAACATTPSEDVSATAVYDPLEGVNRQIYAFNDGVDRVVLEPVARGYRAVTNEPIRGGVSNFLTNLNQPVVFANTILQGKPGAAIDTFSRFAVNTTFGLAGILDVATPLNVPEHKEDFGQTLQVWGVAPGPHIVLPLSGSSTVTDSVGSLLGAFTNPLLLLNDTQSQIIVRAVGVVDLRAQLLSAETLVSGDRYLFLRDALLQRRAFLVQDGQIEEDPFLSDEDYDEDEDDWGDDEP